MKNVTIQRMVLHYFKGTRNQEIDFGTETVISGPNGCGKTTIMDAFFWCLWGKNAAGQSDGSFGIKTNDAAGNEIAHVDHEVEMTLLVDGEAQTFKRVLTPKYDKDDNLKGNTTAYYWNDVPMKQGEYKEKVAEVIAEDIFKLITSPYAFLALPWDKQRDALLKMAGDVSNGEVAKENEDLQALLANLSGKTIEEYKREVEAKLKRVNDAMKDIPARIDEVHHSMPEAPDMQECTDALAEAQQEYDEIEKAMHDQASATSTANAARNKAVFELNQLRFEQQQIINAKESEMRNAIHASNVKYNEAEQMYNAIDLEERRDMETCRHQAAQAEIHIAAINAKIADADKQLQQLRDEWWKESKDNQFNAEEYLKCPLFGHICNDGTACSQYEQHQEEAYNTWEAAKQARLDDITKRGKQAAAWKAELQQTAIQEEAALNAAKAEQNLRKQKRSETKQNYMAIMQANPKRPLIAKVDGKELPEWQAIEEKAAAMEAVVNATPAAQATPQAVIEMQQRRSEILGRITQIKLRMAAQQTIDKLNERIQQLEDENRNLGIQKASLEYARRTINDFEIAKTELVGSKVNELFRIVRWQMFQRQVNGEVVPACTCMCGGVRYNDVNKAGKINAGIDIASALMTAYGVAAPMFIDEAEASLNIFNPGTCQRILLRVEPGTGIKIRY